MDAISAGARVMGVRGDGGATAALGGADPLRLAASIEAGLPVAALDRVAEAVAPGDEAFRHRLVPRATLARRRAAGGRRLSPEEGARVARLAAVFGLAREAWGDEAEARDFLARPHPLLDGRRPLDVALATDLGARLVERVLGRLMHGTAA